MSSFLQNSPLALGTWQSSSRLKGSSMCQARCQAPSAWRETKGPSPTELTFGWAGRQIINTQINTRCSGVIEQAPQDRTGSCFGRSGQGKPLWLGDGWPHCRTPGRAATENSGGKPSLPNPAAVRQPLSESSRAAVRQLSLRGKGSEGPSGRRMRCKSSAHGWGVFLGTPGLAGKGCWEVTFSEDDPSDHRQLPAARG